MLDKSAQYTNTDDEKLFSFIEKGDKGAFTQAYDRYHKLLYVLAYRYLMNADMAEDVVQHVFARLWEFRSELRGNQPEELSLHDDEKSCLKSDS